MLGQTFIWCRSDILQVKSLRTADKVNRDQRQSSEILGGRVMIWGNPDLLHNLFFFFFYSEADERSVTEAFITVSWQFRHLYN